MVRAFLALFAAASAAVAQPAYDILIKGGHVIDPKNNLDAVADVAVAGGKIARVAPNLPRESARQTIDATGLYVTPGLIDIHAHMWDRPGAGPGIERVSGAETAGDRVGTGCGRSPRRLWPVSGTAAKSGGPSHTLRPQVS